jgi:hypothetical protein
LGGLPGGFGAGRKLVPGTGFWAAAGRVWRGAKTGAWHRFWGGLPGGETYYSTLYPKILQTDNKTEAWKVSMNFLANVEIGIPGLKPMPPRGLDTAHPICP